MSEKSNISWTDSTHNFWRGCTKVSPGCAHCYAETLVTGRLGGEWGKGKPRVKSKDFDAPLRWNKRPFICDACGRPNANSLVCMGEKCHSKLLHRRHVFALSLGDIWDDEVPIKDLADALDVIRRCPNLIFQLLTKRPENALPRMQRVWREAKLTLETRDWIRLWLDGNAPDYIWIGTSVENQEAADRRIPQLLKIPAAVRFLSCEPLLEAVDLKRWVSPIGRADYLWVIVGGESGPHARPCNVNWIRSIVKQCKAAGVPAFVKQTGSNPSFDRDAPTVGARMPYGDSSNRE